MVMKPRYDQGHQQKENVKIQFHNCVPNFIHNTDILITLWYTVPKTKD